MRPFYLLTLLGTFSSRDKLPYSPFYLFFIFLVIVNICLGNRKTHYRFSEPSTERIRAYLPKFLLGWHYFSSTEPLFILLLLQHILCLACVCVHVWLWVLLHVCMCVWGEGAVKGRMKGSVDAFGFLKKYHSLKVLLCNILEKN